MSMIISDKTQLRQVPHSAWTFVKLLSEFGATFAALIIAFLLRFVHCSFTSLFLSSFPASPPRHAIPHF